MNKIVTQKDMMETPWGPDGFTEMRLLTCPAEFRSVWGQEWKAVNFRDDYDIEEFTSSWNMMDSIPDLCLVGPAVGGPEYFQEESQEQYEAFTGYVTCPIRCGQLGVVRSDLYRRLSDSKVFCALARIMNL